MFDGPQTSLVLTRCSSLCFQLKARQEQVNGNPLVLDELRTAILLAEEAFPGISDSLVAHMVHRLQRYHRALPPAGSFSALRILKESLFLFFSPASPQAGRLPPRPSHGPSALLCQLPVAHFQQQHPGQEVKSQGSRHSKPADHIWPDIRGGADLVLEK